MSISFCRSLAVILAFEFSVTKLQSIKYYYIYFCMNKNAKMLGEPHNKCPDHRYKKREKQNTFLKINTFK